MVVDSRSGVTAHTKALWAEDGCCRQVRAREQAAAAERRRQQTRAQAAAAERARELESRRGRVVAAKQRAAAAARDGEDLQRSKADQMQGVERQKCGDCTECPGFECHFRAQDSLDVEVFPCQGMTARITTIISVSRQGCAEPLNSRSHTHSPGRIE